MSRYKDAYFVAGSVSGIGAFIKIVGCIIAVVFIFAFLVLGAASKSTPLIFGGIGIATSVGVPIYILGVLVSAIGQHTKATMDCAVHTSPFLSDPEKAEVMSIR